MDITEQEVWLRAYCAAVNGRVAGSNYPLAHVADALGKELADLAVKSFAEKFPKFQFVSNENK